MKLPKQLSILAPNDDTKRFRLYQALCTAARLQLSAGVADEKAVGLENRALSEPLLIFGKYPDANKLLGQADSVLKAMSKAPEIQGVDAADHPRSLSCYRGKVVMLNFFANRCGFCRSMYPLERRLVTAYDNRPFALLGVNIQDEDEKVIRQLIEQGEITWPCWGEGSTIAAAWRVYSTPVIFLIDHRGAVVQWFIGGVTTQRVEDNAHCVHEIDVRTLHAGQNCLAVAVHQCSQESSDLSFDLKLTAWSIPRTMPILRFGNLIGVGPRQIPLGAKVRNARLSITSPGRIPNFGIYHVAPTCVSEDTTIDTIPTNSETAREFVVMDSLQQWASGMPNEGWAIEEQQADLDTHSRQLQLRLNVEFWPQALDVP